MYICHAGLDSRISVLWPRSDLKLSYDSIKFCLRQSMQTFLLKFIPIPNPIWNDAALRFVRIRSLQQEEQEEQQQQQDE